jgi:hypothetical protein
MAKGKWQRANGVLAHLKFAILPFEIQLSPLSTVYSVLSTGS